MSAEREIWLLPLGQLDDEWHVPTDVEPERIFLVRFDDGTENMLAVRNDSARSTLSEIARRRGRTIQGWREFDREGRPLPAPRSEVHHGAESQR